MFGSGRAASAAAETPSTPATTSSATRLIQPRLARNAISVDGIEEMGVLRRRPERDPLALLRHALRVDPGDEPCRLARDLGRAEHERVGADLLGHLDLGRDAVGRELERL